MKNPRQTAALAAALCGYSIFGFSFLATRIAATIATPFMLLAFRNLTAFLLMTLMLPFLRGRLNFRRKGAWRLLILGLMQPVLYAVAETYGITLAGSAIAGSIIATAAIVSFLLAVLFLKEKFRISQFLWSAGSVVGVCMLSLPGASTGTVHPFGIVLILFAVLFSSLYSVLTKRLSDRFNAFERTYAMFFTGSVSFVALSFIQSGADTLKNAADCLADRRFMLCILFLAVCSSVIAFLLLNYAYAYLTVKQTAAFSSVTTVISAAAGVLLLHEPLGMAEFAGIAVILVCVYMVAARGGDTQKNT